MSMMARRDQYEGNSLLVGAEAVAVLLGKSVRTINRLAKGLPSLMFAPA